MPSFTKLPDALREHIASFFRSARTFSIYQQCCQFTYEDNNYIEIWQAVLKNECFQHHGIKDVWTFFNSILKEVDMNTIRRVHKGIHKAPEIEMSLKYYAAITTSNLDNVLRIAVDCIESLTIKEYSESSETAILLFRNIAYFFVRKQSELKKPEAMKIGIVYSKVPCVFNENQVIHTYIPDPVCQLSVMDLLSKPISVIHAEDGFIFDANQSSTSTYDYSKELLPLLK